MIARDKLDEIRERLDRASPAQWVSYIEGRDHWGGDDVIVTGIGGDRGPDIEVLGATKDDKDFIAHSRQDVQLLLDEVTRLYDEMDSGGRE
ncbi:MAG: hypothetical protein CL534_27195 [Ahrensia sp.]|nr:hypothetical protein [Ahrensia sp.]